MGKVIKMSQFDKIWMEVDVEQDREEKTKKIKEIIDSLDKIDCVCNVTKVQYRMPESEEE